MDAVKIRPRAYAALKAMAQLGRGMTFTELASKLGGSRGQWSFAIQECEHHGLIDRRGAHSYADATVTEKGLAHAAAGGEPRTYSHSVSRRRSPGLAADGGTRYKQTLRTPGPDTPVFQMGRANVKLGHRVLKGRHKGRKIFSLTLEEGRTCP